MSIADNENQLCMSSNRSDRAYGGQRFRGEREKSREEESIGESIYDDDSRRFNRFVAPVVHYVGNIGNSVRARERQR